jgi:hypothetical protein
MNAEQIKGYLTKNVSDKAQCIKISFQKRDPVYGLFLTEEKDSEGLSAKNFWRIVTQKNLEAYKKTGDVNLSRIFSGSDMTRLSLVAE